MIKLNACNDSAVFIHCRKNLFVIERDYLRMERVETVTYVICLLCVIGVPFFLFLKIRID